MKVAILSPHLDDAVLSCWHVLEAADEVVVVNVFTASPPEGTAPPPWDRETGASDPVVRMAERRAEDERALAVAGRAALDIGLLDFQYRSPEEGYGSLADRLRDVLERDTVIYAPAALKGHPDHVAVRDAALALGSSGWRVVLYADLPHGITEGWPSWVTGTPEPPGTAVGAQWAGILAEAGLAVERLTPRVRPLDDHARRRKLVALDEYRTQRAALDQLAFAPLAEPAALAYEVSWEVAPSALRDPHEAGGDARVAHAGGDPLDGGR